MNDIPYPIRLNRYLYLQNICSRREADRLIESGKVFVNGKPAKIGQKIESSDKVTLSQSAEKKVSEKIYIVMNKPVGVVSHDPQQGEQSATDLLPREYRSMNLAPLGRLDKASHGLLLLSNDGTIVDKLLNPKNNHEKEYVVEVDKHLDKNFYESMAAGVNIEGYRTKPATIKKVANKTFSLVLTEGKKHQIRRMCAALGYQVVDLKRIRVQNIKLGKLKPGEVRTIEGLEQLEFLKSIGVDLKKRS